MRNPDDEPLRVIRWAYRFLYVLLFIALMVVMGYWELPSTLPFLGAMLALLLPLLFSKRELFEREEETREKTAEVLLNEQ